LAAYIAFTLASYPSDCFQKKLPLHNMKALQGVGEGWCNRT